MRLDVGVGVFSVSIPILVLTLVLVLYTSNYILSVFMKILMLRCW